MKILKIVYNLFFVCIAVVAILLIASIFPITGSYKVMIVQSGSMEPAIHTGAVVISKPVAEYKVGDIITFSARGSSKTTITHRIAEIKNENGRDIYLTKGDANDGEDSEGIEKNRIVGKIILHIPYAGYVVHTAKTPYGFIALVVIPALFIIFDEIKKIIAEIYKMRKKKLGTEE